MRVLVLSDDRVGPTMAGAALRSWELGCALAGHGHDVRIAAAPESEPPLEGGPPLVATPPWRWAEAVVGPAWMLPPRAFVGRHRIIVDGTTPLLAELAEMPATTRVIRRRRTAAARLPLVMARADAILVAGSAQVEWWSQLTVDRFGLPYLQVPYGVPERPPLPDRDEIPNVPSDWAVVLWWGGVWPWLDLDTLLAARARLGTAPVSVVVPTATRPGAEAPAMSGDELADRCRDYELRSPQVVALDYWVPYAHRARVLNRASLLAVLHRRSDEAALSFRTRALDGVWAGVPLLLSEGGETARLARDREWGGVVPAGDVRATAATMELLLGERQQQRCRRALAADRETWRWSRVVEPLAKALPNLPAVPRRGLLPAALRSALRLAGRGRKTVPR